MEIEGTEVLVTGATGGLGLAIADAFASAGARLTVTGRREPVLAGLVARHPGTRTVVADLGAPGGVDAVVAAGADADVVVANAALPASGLLLDLEPAAIDQAIAVNLQAPIQLARALAPGLVARGRGHLVFVSSLAGLTASPASSLYSATKFGLRGFAHGLRQDLHGSGVGVSVILPGFVRDAGMFADSGATLPVGVGTTTPGQVAAATLRAVRHDEGEALVAPVALKVGALFGSLFPDLAARISRAVGGDQVARDLADGQRSWH